MYNVFQWAGQLPKTAPSCGGSGPHLIHGFLGPPELPPNGISRLNQFIRFCTAHKYNQQTHTGRDHATPSVAIDRIYAMQHACDATQKLRKKPCCGKLGIGSDHPCCWIKIKFCMEVVFWGAVP